MVLTVPILGLVPNERARSMRVAAGSFSLSIAARQSVGTMSVPAPGKMRDVLLPRLFIQRMAFPEDVDLARNVEVVDLLRKTCSRQAPPWRKTAPHS